MKCQIGKLHEFQSGNEINRPVILIYRLDGNRPVFGSSSIKGSGSLMLRIKIGPVKLNRAFEARASGGTLSAS